MPRVAQSAILHALHGNPNNITKKALSKRAKNEKKLSFGTKNLVPPHWLSQKGKTLFKRIVKLYADTTFLNDADVVVLAQYCDWYTEYLACNTRLNNNKRSQNGKPNPDLRLKLQISAELDRLGRELGLTPSARAGLAIHLDDDEDNKSKDDDDEFDD